MHHPVILLSGAEKSVSSFRTIYAHLYDVVPVETVKQAEHHLAHMRQHRVPLALVIVAPERGDILMLASAAFPAAKRLLLTDELPQRETLRAWPQLDAILLPPFEADLVIDDLLERWQAEQESVAPQVILSGSGRLERLHQLATFLTGHGITYRQRATADEPDVAVSLPDGSSLVNPSLTLLADRLGLPRTPKKDHYDLTIVGAGPAGLSAAISAVSEGLATLLVERAVPGGQAGSSSLLENYPGFPAGISGPNLARRLVAQARRLGAEMLSPQEVVSLAIADRKRWIKSIQLGGGACVRSTAVLLALGLAFRPLDIPGAQELTGKGLFYGATLSQAPNTCGKAIHILGGANSAGQAALWFSRYARSVTILLRGPSLEQEMSRYLCDEIVARPNIAVCPHTTVTALHGTDRLCVLTLSTAQELPVQVKTDGLFVFIGEVPQTTWLKAVVRDAGGYVLADQAMLDATVYGWPLDRLPLPAETSLPGVFVAGDVHAGAVRRAAAAVGEGARVVASIHQYLSLGERPV